MDLMRFTTTRERSYKRYIVKTNPAVCYLRHPSGVVVVTLNKQHEVMQKVVSKVQWDTKKKGVNRSKQKVVGKGKKVDVSIDI